MKRYIPEDLLSLSSNSIDSSVELSIFCSSDDLFCWVLAVVAFHTCQGRAGLQFDSGSIILLLDTHILPIHN